MKKQFSFLKTSFSHFMVLLGLFLCTGTTEAQYLDALSDTWSKAPSAAYSTRKVMSTYSGPAMRLRRSNDNAETDVFFDGTGWVSMTSNTGTSGSGVTLSTWVGSNSAYVTRWYDQSGNGSHATEYKMYGTVTCTGNTTLTGSGTKFTGDLAVGNTLYKADGTLIGTINTLTSATSIVLSANGPVISTGSQFYIRETQPMFINAGAMQVMPNGKPALNIQNGSNANVANGFTTTMGISADANVNVFAVLQRTNAANANGFVLGNNAMHTAAASGYISVGYSDATNLGIRATTAPKLATTLNSVEAVNYYLNANKTTTANENAGVTRVDLSGTTTSNTVGSLTWNSAKKIELFRPANDFTYSNRSFTGYCPEVIYYANATTDAVFNASDVTALLSSQKTTYIAQIIPIGASSTYKTIQSAYDGIKTAAVSTPITNQYVFELQSDYDPTSGTTLETYPITLNAINGASAINTITISPAGGQTKTLTSSTSSQIFKFDGAKYVIIDGRAGGVGLTKSLTIENTSTAAEASTITLINDANFNTIKFCKVLGSSTSTTSVPTSGTIVIGTTNGTTARAGADPNYTGSGNLNNTIDQCDIANASGGTHTVGVFMDGTATYTNESNTISNCNIYNYFNPGAFVSAGIYINQNTKTSTINANKFYQDADRTYTHTSGEGVNYGIFSSTTDTDTKAITNNIIGYASNTQTGTMTLKGDKNFRFIGIYVGRPLTTAYGNTIANIDVTTSSVGTTYTGTVCGFYAANNFPAATATLPNLIHDITVRPSASTTGTHTLCGFAARGGSVPTIHYNYIYNLNVTPSGVSSATVIGKLMGIYVGGANSNTIKFNKVYGLTCGVDLNSVVQNVTGISSAAGGTNTIERNLIYDLNVISSGVSIIIGLAHTPTTSQSTIKNNIISLGSNVTANATIYGMNYALPVNGNVFNYHNTIYISGTATKAGGPTTLTYSMFLGGDNATTANHTIQNNIFANQRVNSESGTAKHYAFRFAYTKLNVLKVLNNNLYWATPLGHFNGTGGPVEYANLAAWKSPSNTKILITNDANSTEGNPQFLSASDLRVQTYSSAIAAKGATLAAVTDDYYGTTRATTPAIGAYEFTYASAASDNYRSLATGNWSTAATWQASPDNTNWANATLAPGATAATVTIQNAHSVSLDANVTTSSLSLNSGSILNINAGKQLTVSTTLNNSGTLNLLSTSEDGTATILTPATLGGTGGVYTTNQYLTTGRNWYVSTPSSATALPTVASGTITLNGYSEADVTDVNGSTGWVPNPSTFVSGSGYVASVSASGNITFTGALNTGNKNIALTSRTGTANKAGFNLVGNPYPSYLDWTAVTDDVDNAAKLRSTTMWYRTKMENEQHEMVYNFWTVNGDGVGVPNGASVKIPPMQSFWVRAAEGVSAPIVVTNAMRSHAPGSDKMLKAPSVQNADRILVRLQVSNGVNTDEAVVYFSTKAQNGLDAYDSPKMTNGNAAIPEIYTTLNNERFVINSMNTIPLDSPIGVGFIAGSAESFSIKANEITNLPEDVKLMLKDNVTLAETDLSDNAIGYQFTLKDTGANRFSLIFRTAGSTTDVRNANSLNAQVFVNAANQITIIAPEKSNYAIYNAMGQMIENGLTTAKLQTVNSKLNTGVYVVKVGNESSKVIVK